MIQESSGNFVVSFMFQRSKNNPILKPNEANAWEDFKVYNPGALYENNIYYLFYRARGKNWISSIGYAISHDGETFERFQKPILEPEQPYESNGLEDPRIVKVGNAYFMTYTAFDGNVARLCIATSHDLRNWEKHGKVFQNWDWTKKLRWTEYLFELLKAKFLLKRDWCKAGALFPEMIGNRYWMLFGDRNIWLAHSQNGLEWWPIQDPFLSARQKKYFDNYLLEMGPPPIRTKVGWLVFYHGVNKKNIYRLGFLILDHNDPTKIIYRASKPIFEPQKPYELSGAVDILPGGWKIMEKMNEQELKQFIAKNERKGKMPRVAFVCGAVLVNNKIRIYYGASDTVVCTATANIENILALTKMLGQQPPMLS